MNKNSAFTQKGKTGICTINNYNSVQNYEHFQKMGNRECETVMCEGGEPTITIL